jgi:hypothetical protein
MQQSLFLFFFPKTDKYDLHIKWVSEPLPPRLQQRNAASVDRENFR